MIDGHLNQFNIVLFYNYNILKFQSQQKDLKLCNISLKVEIYIFSKYLQDII